MIDKTQSDADKAASHTHTDMTWKKEISEVLKRHGKVDAFTVGKLALAINQGGVRFAEWLNKKLE